MKNKKLIIIPAIAVLLAFGFIGYYGIWTWVICRTYCPQGQSLKITRKTGAPAPSDAYASEDKTQQGVMEQMKGHWQTFP